MITFDINGTNIKFDVQMENYNTIRKKFKFEAEKESEKFRKNFFKNIYSIKQISDKGLNTMEKHLSKAFKLGVETLVEYGILTIDIDTFKTKYANKYMDLNRLFNNYNKGHLTQNKNKKNNILNRQEIELIEDDLVFMLYNDFFYIHYAVVDVLIENKIIKVGSYINEDSINKSNALFNNYIDGFIDEIDGIKVIKQIIELDPYKEDLYKFMIKEDGDLFNEIDSLASFLGYSMQEYKEELMNEYMDELLKNGQYENYDIIKERIEKYAKYIGCKNDSLFVTKLDAIYTFANA